MFHFVVFIQEKILTEAIPSITTLVYHKYHKTSLNFGRMNYLSIRLEISVDIWRPNYHPPKYDLSSTNMHTFLKRTDFKFTFTNFNKQLIINFKFNKIVSQKNEHDYTVKPLITNTSKEFIKCRILHFLIMECCRYLVF